MLPIVDVAFPGRQSPKSVAPALAKAARCSPPATIAAWLMMLATPADGAAPRASFAPATMSRASTPMAGIVEALACQAQWAEYWALKAVGLPCTPPNC